MLHGAVETGITRHRLLSRCPAASHRAGDVRARSIGQGLHHRIAATPRIKRRGAAAGFPT